MLSLQHLQNSISVIYFERNSLIESFIVSSLAQSGKMGIIVDCERRIRNIADSQKIFIVDGIENLMKVMLNIPNYLREVDYLYVSGLTTPLRPYMNSSFGVKSLAFILSLLDELKENHIILIKNYIDSIDVNYPLYWDIFKRYTDNLLKVVQSGNQFQIQKELL